KARAQMRQHQRRSSIAGNDDQIGTMGLDQLAHKVAHARDELGLAATAVGKEGIVGDVDVARIGPHLGDLAKNGEAAEPGIEDENGGSHGGCWYEKNGRRAMSSRSTRSGVRRLPLAARAQKRRALRPFARVKASFTLAKNRRNLIQPMRA